MAALIVLIALNWRELSRGIGHGMARRRRRKSRRSTISLLVYISFWVLAIVVLAMRPGGLFGSRNTSTTIQREIVGESASIPGPIGLGNSSILLLSNFVQSGWFSIMFAGLIIVCGFILIQSFRESFKEISTSNLLLPARQAESLQAVQHAMKLVDDALLDPRSRIIACYEQLVSAAFRLDVPVSSDQTARELEEKIRVMFMLKGDAIHRLTNLFEEARYSLHEITEDDAFRAMEYLQSIYSELSK